jgi:hypothetical protein
MNVNWRDVVKELPGYSGRVVIYKEYTNSVDTYNYSAEHKLFNCHDHFTHEEAQSCAIEVDKWCYIEDLMEE